MRPERLLHSCNEEAIATFCSVHFCSWNCAFNVPIWCLEALGICYCLLLMPWKYITLTIDGLARDPVTLPWTYLVCYGWQMTSLATFFYGHTRVKTAFWEWIKMVGFDHVTNFLFFFKWSSSSCILCMQYLECLSWRVLGWINVCVCVCVATVDRCSLLNARDNLIQYLYA